MQWWVWSLGGVAAFCFGWRSICKKTSLPWPYWMAWFLENPYMKVFCHPQRIARRVRVQPGMKVLDIGCGAGRISLPLAAEAKDRGKLVGIDMQSGMLRLFRKQIERLQYQSIELRQANFQTVALEDRDFDRVVLVTVLGEIPEHGAVLAKIKNHMKPGGLLSITEVLPDPCYCPHPYVRQQAEAQGFVWVETFRGPLSYTINLMKPT
jgi:ubiquinone/menaquinone biosynthesis C-methylase UbiE